MYKVKNYLLSMQSHWMINHTTYQAVQDSVPEIIKYKTADGINDMAKTPIHKVIKKIYKDMMTKENKLLSFLEKNLLMES